MDECTQLISFIYWYDVFFLSIIHVTLHVELWFISLFAYFMKIMIWVH